nr:hypothetical protein [Candidatus Sigynarchaeum springense]
MEDEIALAARIALILVYLYLFVFFQKNYVKSKQSSFVNKYFFGYAYFFFVLFCFQVVLSIYVITSYFAPASTAWLRANFPGKDDPMNRANLFFLYNLVMPLYIFGMTSILVLIAGQIYPLETTINWRRVPGTKYMIIVAVSVLFVFIPGITWTIYSFIVFLGSIIGVLYGLIFNVGVNIRIAIRSTGELRRQSIIIILASLLFYAGFIYTLEIAEISLGRIVGIVISMDWDITFGCILQGLAALLYKTGLGTKDYRKVVGLIEYFQSKHFCIVHRGPIEGQIFMCGSCGTFYCGPCKEAIIQAENKCWNCGNVLVRSLDVSFTIKTTEPLYQEFLKLKGSLVQKTDKDAIIVLVNIMNKIVSFDESGILQAEIKKAMMEAIQERQKDSTIEAREAELKKDLVVIGPETRTSAPQRGVVAGKEPSDALKKSPQKT